VVDFRKDSLEQANRAIHVRQSVAPFKGLNPLEYFNARQLLDSCPVAQIAYMDG
jgi:hypothetical protein